MADPIAGDEPLPPFRLSVAPGAAQEFELWRWAVSPMFDVSPRRPEEQSSFTLASSVHYLADMAVARTRSSASIFERSGPVIAKSGIDNVTVQLYLEGDYHLDAEGRQTHVRAGDVALFMLDRRSLIVTEDYANISIVMPRRSLAPLVENLDDLHGLVLRKGTPLNALLTSHIVMLQAQAGRIGAADGGAVVQGTAALVAACLGPSAEAREQAAKRLPAASLHAIRQAIETGLADPGLGPDSLAERFGLSRATLYRIFEPLGGISGYIQHRRLMHAYRMLSNPAQSGERIGVVARRVGFTNDTMFSRAFRDLYHITPSEVRAAVQAGYAAPAQSDGRAHTSFRTLNRWLLGLEAGGM